MFMQLRRWNGASGCMSTAVTFIGETVKFFSVGLACVAKTGGNGGANLAELPHLIGSESIEQMPPYTLNMPRRGGFKRSEPRVGQHGELTPSVGSAELAPDPAVLLESSDGVG
jgi:hypothetical protein